MRRDKKSKVLSYFSSFESVRLTVSLAVTLEGTVIHKSGLITGGRSSHNINKKWNEKDVDGTSCCLTLRKMVFLITFVCGRAHPCS